MHTSPLGLYLNCGTMSTLNKIVECGVFLGALNQLNISPSLKLCFRIFLVLAS